MSSELSFGDFNMIQTLRHKLEEYHPNHYRIRHIAGIWYKNRLIALGYNQKKTHPLQERYKKNPYSVHIHAEIDAIKNFLKTHSVSNLSGATLVVISVRNSDGAFRNSCPCDGCTRAIAAFSIKRVVHT